ncbi:hypothetical protein DLR11_11500 [Salmonella enterica subsp. salamae]|nr:hypothetical protein [Salmonella enterica subsp. salamae]ECG1476369.1 hypothetical protein [Salmonella enterica subsp. salamae]ECI3452442.1 hypothetical protein [Salmonella enterica subsp. salamae]ECI4075680.1 hypothetical protein [Salmonella enterica subsp. salamae]MJZ02163.1 hypothetical protein [Salmonella enterica subsp. salamae]
MPDGATLIRPTVGRIRRLRRHPAQKKRVNPAFFRLNNAAAAFLLPERQYLTAGWLLTFP